MNLHWYQWLARLSLLQFQFMPRVLASSRFEPLTLKPSAYHHMAIIAKADNHAGPLPHKQTFWAYFMLWQWYVTERADKWGRQTIQTMKNTFIFCWQCNFCNVGVGTYTQGKVSVQKLAGQIGEGAYFRRIWYYRSIVPCLLNNRCNSSATKALYITHNIKIWK